MVGFVVAFYLSSKKKPLKLCFRNINMLLAIGSTYGILEYTVFGRVASEKHTFQFFASYTNEFYREMFMNALLYYPFGLTLTVLIGPWSILVSFLVSVTIESWQYLSGSGLAQGTDVIMNTLGAAIGTIPWFVVRWIMKYRKASE